MDTKVQDTPKIEVNSKNKLTRSIIIKLTKTGLTIFLIGILILTSVSLYLQIVSLNRSIEIIQKENSSLQTEINELKLKLTENGISLTPSPSTTSTPISTPRFTSTPLPTPTFILIPFSGTYTDSQYQFSLKYPDSWELLVGNDPNCGPQGLEGDCKNLIFTNKKDASKLYIRITDNEINNTGFRGGILGPVGKKTIGNIVVQGASLTKNRFTCIEQDCGLVSDPSLEVYYTFNNQNSISSFTGGIKIKDKVLGIYGVGTDAQSLEFDKILTSILFK